MFRQKTILLLAVLLLIIFFITTNYLLVTLPTESEVKISLSVEDLIYKELQNLPVSYKYQSKSNEENLSIYSNFKSITKQGEDKIERLWQIANSWVNNTQLLDINSPYVGDILLALQHTKIIQADIDPRGTQLKLLLTLQGNQQVIFKPKWYDRTKIVEGPVYAGKDRYNSEIIAFYLSVILNHPLCPISVERIISLKEDILPVATKRLHDTTIIKNNKTCIYGKCFYCSINDPICDDENSSLLGAVIFNFKASLLNHRSPWQRTYKKGKNAVWQEFPESYCKIVEHKISRKRLYDLIDISLFDFIIQNGDRHHYETLDNTVLWLDNGKGLGNPFKHHIDILAPLYQCCIMRKSTMKNLMNLTGGRLTEKLQKMPNIKNLITTDHLQAMEDRLLIIFATIEYCKKYKKSQA
ncbi:glycosaminoglycan xylosylkinase homolog [Diabrotica virgifera virgifera]|uniref:FAM20 C-terminal domain-containing protein n=1 Tax=Diabrotica virgifera virgifera TaxID=50390 RepID=A0ABM5JQE8_DIAVI|nr:glycosaminoglycan xylosylkinase homolog [Diabrotica virgifera virgifera]